MSEIAGLSQSPAELVERVFQHIHQQEMAQMSFCRDDLNVTVSPFQCVDGQWTGVVFTPWMLSLMIFPGPDDIWPRRQVTSKLGIKLAGSDYLFNVGEHEELGQYLSCSLMSPIKGVACQQEADKIVSELSRMVWAFDCKTESIDEDKRRLFSGFRNEQSIG